MGSTAASRPPRLLRQRRGDPVLLPGRHPVIQAQARLRGRPRPVNDAWVAACCIARDLPLATLNTKDYIDFAEHEGLTLIR